MIKNILIIIALLGITGCAITNNKSSLIPVSKELYTRKISTETINVISSEITDIVYKNFNIDSETLSIVTGEDNLRLSGQLFKDLKKRGYKINQIEKEESEYNSPNKITYVLFLNEDEGLKTKSTLLLVCYIGELQISRYYEVGNDFNLTPLSPYSVMEREQT